METYHPSERPHTRQPKRLLPLPNYKGVFASGLLSLIFGIVGLITPLCLPALILGVVALVMGSNGKKLYRSDPEEWEAFSIQRMQSGFTMGIVGLCLGGVGLVVNIAILILLIASGHNSMSPFVYSIF